MTDVSIWDSEIVFNAQQEAQDWTPRSLLDAMTECANYTAIYNPPIPYGDVGKYALNPIYHREAQKRYRNRPSNRDKIRTRGQNRRARVLSQPNTLTNDQWQHAIEYFGHRCAVCGRSPDFWTVLAMDHWVSLLNGGGTTAKNIIPLCHPKNDAPVGYAYCNSSKAALLAEDWLVSRYGKCKAAEIIKRIETYFSTLL